MNLVVLMLSGFIALGVAHKRLGGLSYLVMALLILGYASYVYLTG